MKRDASPKCFRSNCDEAIAALETLAKWGETRGGKLPGVIEQALVAGECLFITNIVDAGAGGTDELGFPR